MSKYSWIDRETNTVHPWSFSKRPTNGDNVYVFMVGNITVAQLFNMGRSWSAIIWTEDPIMRLADGFRSRHAAAEFALKSARMTDV